MERKRKRRSNADVHAASAAESTVQVMKARRCASTARPMKIKGNETQ